MTTPAANSAALPSAAPAATPFFDPVDAVNTPAGSPAQERYPGAVDATEYGPGSGPQPPGGTGGPPFAGSPAVSYAGSPGVIEAAGGGYQDAAWMTGYDAPQAAWDSSAGAPFAPSGALNPDLHGVDTGGVYVHQHVVPAAIGLLTRRTMAGQTTVRNGSGNQLTKDNQTSANDRTDLDQQQWHNPDGYDPWDIPYSERGIENNLAYESTPMNATDSPYTPSGALPDLSVYDYAAQAYDAPPDPYMGTVSQQSSNGGGIGGDWVL